MRRVAIIPLLPLALAGANDWLRPRTDSLPVACDALATPATAAQVLTCDYGLTPHDLARLGRGKVFSNTVPTQDDREIAVLGVVRIPTSPSRFTSFADDIDALMDYEYLTEIAWFKQNSTYTDSFEIPVRREDVSAVRSCVPGKCDMKLSTETIATIARLDPATGDFSDRVSGLVRDRLRRYLRDYRTLGNEGLPVYGDKQVPGSVHDGLRHLLDESGVLRQRAPHLYRHLDRPSISKPAHIRVGYFWSIEDFGMRPLTTMSESAIYGAQDDESWVALKLLYSSHYLMASLRVIRVVQESSAEPGPSAYLVWDDRALFDGRVGGIKRMLLARHLRLSLAHRLTGLRDRLGEYDLLLASGGAEPGN